MKPYTKLNWTPELINSFWDYHSQFPESYFTSIMGDEMVRRLQPYLKGRRSVLDFGCGAGHLLEHLAKRGYAVTGTDSSEESLVATRERLAGYDGFQGAYKTADLLAEGRRFDAIFVVEVVEHLYDDILDGLLATLQKLSAPDGIIIITTPNREPLAESEVFCPVCNHVFHRWQHVRSWSKATLSAYLEQRGFVVTRVFSTDFELTFHNGRDLLSTFRKKLWYWLRLKTKGPHLVAVCKS